MQDSRTRCVRWTPFQGMCVMHEGYAYDETGWQTRVYYGVADTFFTCPARTIPSRGKCTYGFVTPDTNTAGDDILRFHALPDQRDAKRSFRESTQR
jgi:hypothetical protein